MVRSPKATWPALARDRFVQAINQTSSHENLGLPYLGNQFLVALVSLGNLATIEAGMGAVYFAGVVVMTMLAAESFDPRLIWDRVRESSG